MVSWFYGFSGLYARRCADHNRSAGLRIAVAKSSSKLELASAVVMGYAPFPKFVPTHVTNFGSTTSRSVARRNHARGPDFAVQRHSRFPLESWRRQNRTQN